MTVKHAVKILSVLAILTALLISIPSALAVEGAYSNYVPGFYGDFGVAVAPDPGFYLRNDFYYYMADGNRQRIVQGDQIRADLDIDIATYMLTGLIVLDQEILGGRYAFGADIPIVYTSLAGNIVAEPGPTIIPFDESGTKIGDLGVFPAMLYWTFGDFHLNLYESIIVPVGSYDKNRAINGGLNYWSFDTVLGATYLNPEQGHELSGAFGYIYNTKNNDTDYHSGQELHFDYMLNQFLSETFAVGVHGFVYKQITGDSGSGAFLGDFKGEAAGIGPALLWATKMNDTDIIFSAKWLHEFHAKNRLEGDHLFFNVTLAF
ncbi:MAG: SphA family protein [Planctomycetota bacterium]|jgi:hypothetical protein